MVMSQSTNNLVNLRPIVIFILVRISIVYWYQLLCNARAMLKNERIAVSLFLICFVLYRLFFCLFVTLTALSVLACLNYNLCLQFKDVKS